MRRKFICGNWKMNGTPSETEKILAGIIGWWDDKYRTVEIGVCPPYISVQRAVDIITNAGVQIAVGAQNCYSEDKGAFTGEVSPRMLAEAGCTYVILGHSERRTLFGETDEIVNKKIHRAVSAGLKPILCIGETLEEREHGRTFEVLLHQVTHSLRDVTSDQMKFITIAYEPVWAIGTGRTATPETAQDAHSFIRLELGKLFGDDAAEQIQILYGGSMKPENARALLEQTDIDGGLIGGASLEPKSFIALIEAALF
jgi:triosephosphate isomerase